MMGENLQVTTSLVEELSPLASKTVGRDRADVGHERARLIAERLLTVHWLITLSEEMMADVSEIRAECTSAFGPSAVWRSTSCQFNAIPGQSGLTP